MWNPAVRLYNGKISSSEYPVRKTFDIPISINKDIIITTYVISFMLNTTMDIFFLGIILRRHIFSKIIFPWIISLLICW